MDVNLDFLVASSWDAQMPERLRWLRIVGDSVFLSGVASLVWFAVGLLTGWSYESEVRVTRGELPEPSVS